MSEGKDERWKHTLLDRGIDLVWASPKANHVNFEIVGGSSGKFLLQAEFLNKICDLTMLEKEEIKNALVDGGCRVYIFRHRTEVVYTIMHPLDPMRRAIPK